MPYYENIFIARQDVTSAQVEALTEHFSGIVTAQGGNVTKKEFWGLAKGKIKMHPEFFEDMSEEDLISGRTR